MPQRSHHGLLFSVLIMTIILDIMGMGLVIPILPKLLLSSHTPLVADSATEALRNTLYGPTLAAWPCGMFFGNAAIGTLSDRLGRKPMLQLCLFGMALTYGLGALGITLHSVSLFMLSRLLNGAASGSFILAQASIVDISEEGRVTQNLGWITFAANIGFVGGPLVCSSLMGLFHHTQAPFLFATALSLVNLILLTQLLPQTPPASQRSHTSWLKTLCAFTILLRDSRIRILGQTFLIFQCAWGFYVEDIMAVMSVKYHLNATQEGLFMAVFGMGSLLNILLIQPLLLKRYRLKTVSWIGLISFSVLLAGFPLYTRTGLWISGMLLCAAETLLYSALMGLFSASVSSEEQGQIMGSVGSLFGISWGVCALTLGPLMSWSIEAPIGIGVICLIASLWRFSTLRD